MAIEFDNTFVFTQKETKETVTGTIIKETERDYVVQPDEGDICYLSKYWFEITD